MYTPNFDKIIQLVYKKSPLQKKKLKKYLSLQDQSFFLSAENFAGDYSSYLESQNIPLEYAVDVYLKMCSDMVKSQIYFMKTGKYPVESDRHVFDNIYDDENEMKPFMIGLAISQFLWSSHYKIYQFFIKSVTKEKDNIKSFLEIGPGHGLFLKDAYKILGNNTNFVAIDISKTSIEITKSIMSTFFKRNQIKYIVMDMLDYYENERFDFIAMGEVIEHVNHPELLLSKFNKLLSDKGHGFVSTCVNCPTIDHVYHFKYVDDIRKMIDNNDLIIKDELILPVEDLPMDEVIKKKIPINYCATMERKKED